jgi:hypothetical protein
MSDCGASSGEVPAVQEILPDTEVPGTIQDRHSRMLYRENDPHEIIGLWGCQFASSGVKHPFMNI